MATYAAQIDCMDQGVGRILKTLKQKNALKNTVVIFLSDNGGCAEPAGKGDIDIIGTAKTNESYRTAWANASDTPFRRYKQEVHEGGIATPLIIRWPKGVEVGEGSFCHTVGHVIDIMPTCLGLAGAKYPAKYKGKDIYPCAGKSLVPVFSGNDVLREALYFEHQANRAIRMGKWKLVSKGTKNKPYTGPWELYDLEKDRTELNDLSKQEPAIAKKLKEMWHNWAVENNVYPLDNRGWYAKIKADVSGKR
jgi:arylsulfatase A-like enzyme